MDGYGRLLPAPNRFPSSINGAGFKPLADDIHRLGLKFGVHLMRGIRARRSRRTCPSWHQAHRARHRRHEQHLPLEPRTCTASTRRPGAQAYYDSVFALFASWGVDFVEMDDMSRPYDAHAPEIEAAHRAIEASKRPMLLSLTRRDPPCPAPSTCAALRRCGASVTTSGTSGRCSNRSSPASKTGTPPPPRQLARRRHAALGRLALGERDSRFNRDEQRTVMAFQGAWARSPLIMGGDLRHPTTGRSACSPTKSCSPSTATARNNQPHFVTDNWRV